MLLKYFSRYRRLCFFACIASSFALFAEDTPSQSLWDYNPIHIGGNLLRIGRASVDAEEGGHLYFRKNNAFLTMLIPISATSYFFPRIEWSGFTLDWNKNPKFTETHFYYAQFGLMFYSTALEKWRWILRAEYSIDLEHFSRPSTYGQFSALAWGAYEIYDRWHYHVGAMGYIGLKGSIMYPVIGVDFSPTAEWTLEAIFPITYSVQYKPDKHWKISLKGRPLKERCRVGHNQIQSRSIFNYATMGTELNIHYEQFMRFEIEGYFGYNFGGDFYIKNEGGHKPLYTELKGAPYGGANIDYAF